jgi:hypothetical protein
MITPIRTAGGAAVAAVVLVLAGCGAGSGEDLPPPLPFGSPPAGSSPSPQERGGTARPTGKFGERPAATPAPTHVSPGFSTSPCATPPSGPAGRLCLSGRVVDPVIDPRAPCADLDTGRYRDKHYVCLNAAWEELDFR